MPFDESLLDYDVLDRHGRKLGRVDAAWTDGETGKPTFASVKTGWLLGRNHLVPLADARYDDTQRALQIPFDAETVKSAPHVAAGDEVGLLEARQVWDHYLSARAGEETEIPLHGERIDVDRRVEDLGGVRLRKIVRKEVVMQPVEVLREHVVVERLGPEELDAAERRAIGRDDEIVLRERGEVPVIQKEPEVIGAVRAERIVERARENVQTDRRIEDVHVEREDRFD